MVVQLDWGGWRWRASVPADEIEVLAFEAPQKATLSYGPTLRDLVNMPLRTGDAKRGRREE